MSLFFACLYYTICKKHTASNFSKNRDRIILMTKYQKHFLAMIDENKQFFDTFEDLHDKYKKNPEQYQDEYNKMGEKALDIIRRYEQSVVAKSTTSQYAKFSNNLSEKFWDAVRGKFPMIDFVGVTS